MLKVLEIHELDIVVTGDKGDTLSVYQDVFQTHIIPSKSVRPGAKATMPSEEVCVGSGDPGVDFNGVWVTSCPPGVKGYSAVVEWCKLNMNSRRAIVVHNIPSALLSTGHHVVVWANGRVVHLPSYREVALHICSELLSSQRIVHA